MRIPLRSFAGALIALGAVAACSVDKAGLGGADAGTGGGAGGSAAPDASGTAGAGTGGGAAGRGGTTGVAGASGGAAGTGVAGGGAGTGGGGRGGLGGAGIGGGGAGAAGTGAGLAGSSGGTGIAGSGAGMGGGGAAGTGVTGGAGTGIAGMGGGGAAGTGMGGGAGTAPTGCNAVTCPLGCCRADGQCITARNNQTCGNAGAACRACGGCFRCGTLGSCEPTPTATWTVVCSSATIAPLKPSGAVWDSTSDMTPGTWPDALCEMTVDDDDSHETSVVTDSLMPTWNQEVNPNGGPDVTSSLLMSTQDRWVITIIDRDGTATASDTVCEVVPHLTAQDLERGTVTLSSGSCTQINLVLTCDQN